MAREVIIQIRLPVWSARRWFAIIAVACALGAGAVYAKVNWTPFVGGAKLTSQQLNDNFKALADAVELLQAQPPPASVLPHVFKGNVDLGVYLGAYGVNGGASHLVYSPAVKAPVILNAVLHLYFDGANCKGNAFSGGLDVLNDGTGNFTNLAFNTATGNMFQKVGPIMQMVGSFSNLDPKGVCQAQPQFVNNMFPVKDTMVANINAGGAYEWSIQMK